MVRSGDQDWAGIMFRLAMGIDALEADPGWSCRRCPLSLYGASSQRRPESNRLQKVDLTRA